MVFLLTYRKHSILYVEHDILLSKLDHYGKRGLDNVWLKSYLSNRKQYVSVNGYDSNLADAKFGVPQETFLGPLLLLIYSNNLNQALRFYKVHHFADDTNLIYFSKSVYKLNKYVSLDLKNFTYWLNANKISLNVKKTELVIFRHQRKKLRACSIVVSDLRSEAKGSRFESGCYLCAEVSSLQ